MRLIELIKCHISTAINSATRYHDLNKKLSLKQSSYYLMKFSCPYFHNYIFIISHNYFLRHLVLLIATKICNYKSNAINK